ncbi:glycyl-radical enzyme activating protein [Carboxylicivirga sediminis]|uniref:Glycyl-radical enzyme activating protein n=1 Tax=Carboxylicivirga sediminis TaxID=2006564 RepID=A0A941IXA1_9BACT|nr:glycyl-radical enzyme activating protein [Carboxylicivirga sediminis]MBR8535845.1 glycyl-radical enzyme activating protein [Carboxylicivirga sediminis]
MNELTAIVFKVESLNTHNGPGYRTVVYFKGCPLKCQWCHNPESISPQKEIWVVNKRCIGCESCVQVCPTEALSMASEGIKVDRQKCTGCQICANVCPSKAIEKLGDEYTVDQLFERIMGDKPFWDASGGGVTLTGGEPATYSRFCIELLKKCKKEGIHTAFDTSGFVSQKVMQELLPYIDLVFFDLKILIAEKAKQLTGQGTKEILASLQVVKSFIEKYGAPELQIRTPLIPDATDTQENLNAISVLLEKNLTGLFTKWELCMFNDVCEDKYIKMNQKWRYTGKKYMESDLKKMNQFQEKHSNNKIEITGFVSR